MLDNNDINNISKIINDTFNYKNIDENSPIKLRNIKNGVQLSDALYYKLLYTSIDSTKESITSKINENNKTSFDTGSFESKENNIPINVYQELFNKIVLYYNDLTSTEDVKIIAMDGTYNNNYNYNEVTNMGFYNISKSIPVNLKSYGTDGKNKEIQSATNFILENIDYFKNVIIIGDRAYFSYEFIDFLIKNGLKFIIRVRGEAINLNPNTIVKKGIKNYEEIVDIKNKIRVIKCLGTYKKIVYFL